VTHVVAVRPADHHPVRPADYDIVAATRQRIVVRRGEQEGKTGCRESKPTAQTQSAELKATRTGVNTPHASSTDRRPSRTAWKRPSL
jgi:hypothetical protein